MGVARLSNYYIYAAEEGRTHHPSADVYTYLQCSRICRLLGTRAPSSLLGGHVIQAVPNDSAVEMETYIVSP